MYMIALGVVLSIFFRFALQPDAPPHPFFIDVLVITTVVTLLWESILQVNRWLDYRYNWAGNARLRLVLQLLVLLVVTPLVLITLMWLMHFFLDRPDNRPPRGMDPLFIPAVLITGIIISIEVGAYFFKEWKKSVLEAQKYRVESANAQLLNLKEQINPHFLFNNLSVLTSLIRTDQDNAIKFVNELSKVYRYGLENKSAELVTLQEELEFLEHYLYLLSIRYVSSISFTFNVDETMKRQLLPPMCLQMLVENTIQHNEASKARPLAVSLYTDEGFMVIENPIQLRLDHRSGSQTGLANIQSRFSFFTRQKVEVYNDGRTFRVKLPLLAIS